MVPAHQIRDEGAPTQLLAMNMETEVRNKYNGLRIGQLIRLEGAVREREVLGQKAIFCGSWAKVQCVTPSGPGCGQVISKISLYCLEPTEQMPSMWRYQAKAAHSNKLSDTGT